MQIIGARRPIGLRLELASLASIAGVGRARIVVVAVDHRPRAYQRRTVSSLQALIRVGAGVAIITADPLDLPLQNTRVGTLLGRFVTPSLLAWVLRVALVRRSRLAGSARITTISIRAGVSVLARVTSW